MLERQLVYVLEDEIYKIENWRKDYNEYKPHSGLTNKTPAEFAEAARAAAIKGSNFHIKNGWLFRGHSN